MTIPTRLKKTLQDLDASAIANAKSINNKQSLGLAPKPVIQEKIVIQIHFNFHHS